MRLFYLSFILILTTYHAKSQSRPGPSDPGAKIIRFYPNPAITQITFDFQNNNSRDYSFQIFNFIGKKVFELSSISTAKTTVDLTNFFRGMYVFQLKDKNGKIAESGRFQVSK